MLWLGTAVRSNMSNSFGEFINFNVMVQATPMFRLGYAYDYLFGTRRTMISYDLIREKGKVITPRYFLRIGTNFYLINEDIPKVFAFCIFCFIMRKSFYYKFYFKYKKNHKVPSQSFSKRFTTLLILFY